MLAAHGFEDRSDLACFAPRPPSSDGLRLVGVMLCESSSQDPQRHQLEHCGWGIGVESLSEQWTP